MSTVGHHSLHLVLDPQARHPVQRHHCAQDSDRRPQPDIPDVTPESIAAAKAAQRAERQRVTDQTGLVITDDGHIEPADDVLVGMHISNWVWFAVNGPQGQL